jgi:triosephosphate isomerase
MVAGNWKMHKTPSEARDLVTALLPRLMSIEGVEKVLCPPFTALPIVAKELGDGDIDLGAQDMHWEEEGAFTGEISPMMLKELCTYVIIGHSERRAYFEETDETVNKKVLSALDHGLSPILCLGETLEQREAGSTVQVVSRQVTRALEGVSSDQVPRIVIAYEPIWAIGTGKAATPEEANRVIERCLREQLAERFSVQASARTRILYGGSVKPHNAASFFSQPEIDGALVGGASLKAEDFAEIVRAARS